MTILLAATSAADVTIANTSIASSTTTAQLAVDVLEGFQSGVSAASSFLYFDLAQKVTEFWCSFSLYRPNTTANNGGVMFEAYDLAYSTTQAVFRINQTGTTNSTFRFQYWSGSAWVDAGSMTFIPTIVAVNRIDLHLKLADTGGVLEAYLNSALVYTNTVTDTLITGVVGIDRISLGSLYSAPYSALIAATEDTRAMTMVQCVPNAAGANTDWSGTFGNIDETGFNDGDFIATGTAGEASYQFTTVNPSYDSSAFEFKGVVVSGRMAKGSGSLDIHALTRVGSTDYDGGSFGATIGIGGKQKAFDVNPATGVNWTYAEIIAAEFGVKAV